jgi:hypothetical protein
METEVLPYAVKTGRSLPYAYRSTAQVAALQGSYETSRRYLARALDACRERGALHTERRLQVLRRVLERA